MARASNGSPGDGEGHLVSTPWGSLFVREHGPARSPPVLLLHALGTDMSIWDLLVTRLAGARHVIRIDAPGHGRSPVWVPGTLSLESLARAHWSVLDQLVPGRVDLLGTSMGAVVALQVADMAPHRVGRLVLCGAQLQRVNASADEMRQRSMTISQSGMGQMVDTMVERWFPPRRDGDDHVIKEHLRSQMLQTTPVGYIACSKAMAHYDLSAALRRLQDRTLLIAGAMDGEIPRQFADLHLQFGESQYVCMADTGHFPHLQRPVEFHDLVDSFIDRGRPD